MGARPAIDAYVSGVRAGAKLKPRYPDRDSREANEEIAKSTDLTVTNFRSLSSWASGTGCYWAKLETPGYFRDITFFVEKNDDGWFVSRVSLTRRCDCAKSVGCKMD